MKGLRVLVLGLLLAVPSCSPGSDPGGGGGGGGGNGGGNNNPPPGNNPAPLVVVSTVPDDGDLDIAFGVNVVITFNQNVAAGTVNANTITFTSNLGPLAGTYTVQGMAVTFNPTNDLPAASPIVATVTTDVMSTTGAQLAQDYQFAFGTAGAAQVIAEGDGIEQPCVAVSAGGLVMTMWVQNDGGNWRLFARGWEAATGWAMTEEFDVSGSTITTLQCYATETNEVVAVWCEGGAAPYVIRTARFVSGQGWDDIENLATDGTWPGVTFTMHREGWGGAYYRATASIYSQFRYLNADGTWLAAVTWNGGGESGPDYLPNFSTGANGELYKTWSNYNPATGSGQHIMWRYVPGAGWSVASLGSVAGAPCAVSPDPNGALTCYASYGTVGALRFDGMNWDAQEMFQGAFVWSPYVALAASSTGDAVAAWTSQPGVGFRDIVAGHLDATGSWNDVQVLDGFDSMTGLPLVASPDTGEGWVLFTQADDDAESVWFARCVPGVGWDMTIELDEDDFPSSQPRLAAQGLGGCAVWLRANGTTQLMARLLD